MVHGVQSTNIIGCNNPQSCYDLSLYCPPNTNGHKHQTMIDFDAIAYGYGDGCDNGWFLLAASDNNEVDDTYFVSLCLDDDIAGGGHDNEPGNIYIIYFVCLIIIYNINWNIYI